MHTRYRIALAALALLALGSVTPTASAAQSPGCEPPAAGSPITVTGQSGVSSSLPFTLDQPAYRVSWTLAAPSDPLTYVTLKSTSGATVDGETLVNASGSEPTTGGQTALYAVKPGTYYLRVRAPSAWTVTFTPIAV